MVVSIGDESDARMAELKLLTLGRRGLACSIRGALPGRLVGLRASKTMLVVSDGGFAILGGVDWSGFLKPGPHPEDAFFMADEVGGVLIHDNYGMLSRLMPDAPSRLRIREDRSQALSIAGLSGEVLTFIPKAQGFPLDLAKEVAAVVSDNIFFKAAAALRFQEEGDADVTAIDGRLMDEGTGTLFPGLIVFGGSDDQHVGFFEPGHFLGKPTRLSEPVIESVFALDDCIVHLPRGMALPSTGFESIGTATKPSELLYVDLRFYPDEENIRMVLAPGRRGAANEYTLSLILPLLSLCAVALSPIDYSSEDDFPNMDDYPDQ